MASEICTSKFSYDTKLHEHVHGLVINGKELKDCDCETCARIKMVRATFKPNSSRASKVGQITHTDIAGPMRVPCMLSGHKYMIIFVDDYSRLIIVYTMKRKSDALEMFKQYLQDTQMKPETLIVDLSNPVNDEQDEEVIVLKGKRSVRSDNGGEYISHEFRDYCAKNGITQEFSSSYTPEQHARAERPWHTLYQMARAMLDTAEMDDQFWSMAIKT